MEDEHSDAPAGEGWDDGMDLDLDLESYMEEDALLDAIQNAPTIVPSTDDFDLDDWGEEVTLPGPGGPLDDSKPSSANKTSASSSSSAVGSKAASDAMSAKGHQPSSSTSSLAPTAHAHVTAASAAGPASPGGGGGGGNHDSGPKGGRRHAQRPPQGAAAARADGKGQGKGQNDPQKNPKKRPFPWKAMGMLTAGVFSAIYFGLGLLEGEPPRAEIPETFLASQPEIQLPVARSGSEVKAPSDQSQPGQRRGSVDVDRSASAEVFNATATEWDGELANQSMSNPDPYFSGDSAKGPALRDRKGRVRGKADNDLAAVANAIR